MAYANCSKCNLNGTGTTTRQGKTTNFKKTKAHSFRTTNISHSPNFYYWANKSFELISKKVPVSMYLSLLLSLTPL